MDTIDIAIVLHMSECFEEASLEKCERHTLSDYLDRVNSWNVPGVPDAT